MGNVGIGTTNPQGRLDVAGRVVSRNLNGLVASSSSYTWAQLSVAGDSACPSGYHTAVALEALVRCYLDSPSCRNLGGGDFWVSGNHDVTGNCSTNLLSHSGTDCWGGEGSNVRYVPTTLPGYHWIVHSPGSYAGSRGPSLGAAADGSSHAVLCVPNWNNL
ncbi:MAG: hypothetical protein HY744_09110 [Deltaproteobacteria bacterium]|nr:hypothetical protein [Deltaproteobacteria bacterium]